MPPRLAFVIRNPDSYRSSIGRGYGDFVFPAIECYDIGHGRSRRGIAAAARSLFWVHERRLFRDVLWTFCASLEKIRCDLWEHGVGQYVFVGAVTAR